MVHLPAVNTLRFDRARNEADRRLGPVRPIFQPKTVGKAVFRIARTRPFEAWLGFSTVTTVFGQVLTPAPADRPLARAGISDETRFHSKVSGRPDNLFEVGRRDPGSHGPFDEGSRRGAVPYNLTRLRGGVLLAALAVLIAGLRTAAGAAVEGRRHGRAGRWR